MSEPLPLFEGPKSAEPVWKKILGTHRTGKRSFVPFDKNAPDASKLGQVESSACQVSIDWLEASIKDRNEARMHQILKNVFGPAFEHQAWSVHRMDKLRYRADGVDGARIEADKIGSVNRSGEAEPWVRVRLPGAACRSVGTESILQLLDVFDATGTLNVSRIDIAADDYSYSFLPRDFAEAAVGPDLSDENAILVPGVVTRVRRNSWDWKRTKGGCLWIGSKGSARLLRVYDKELESNGVIPAVRVELQLRDKQAMRFIRHWLTAHDRLAHLARIFAQHLISFVDFRTPPQGSGRSNSQTWPRQAWWERWVGDLSKASAAPDLRKPVELWVVANVRQSRGFLEVLMQNFGTSLNRLDQLRAGDPETCKALAEALDVVRGEGSVRLSPHHEARLAQMREVAWR